METINPGYSLLGRIGSEPMLLSPLFAGLSVALRRMIAGVGDEEEEFLTKYAATFGDSRAERKPYAFVSGIAVIPVHGVLINRFSSSWGFVTGYDYIRGAFDAALADPQVQGIAFDVDSYGGEVHGCFELSDHIFQNRGKKPTVAIVNANCYSAAYATASSADRIMVTPSGGAGSIGVVTMHVDYSKALADNGITVSFIFAGKHKVDGNPYEPLPDGVRADIQARIDATYDKFVATVARNRGMDAKKVRGTEARTYGADEAKSIGLIDSVAAPKQAFTMFTNELSGSTSQEFDEMTTPTQDDNANTTPTVEAPAAVATPAPTAEAPTAEAPTAEAPTAEAPTAEAPAPTASDAAGERARIKAITTSEEAKGRGTLANHLAFDTTLSVEDARKTLAASPKENSNSPFASAMDTSENPNIGADAGAGGDGGGQLTGAKRIIANYERATGEKFA